MLRPAPGESGRDTVAAVRVFRVANNQHDSVFRSVLRIRCECQRETIDDRNEEVSAINVIVDVRGMNVNMRVSDK